MDGNNKNKLNNLVQLRSVSDSSVFGLKFLPLLELTVDA